jgi:hypothetical protein
MRRSVDRPAPTHSLHAIFASRIAFIYSSSAAALKSLPGARDASRDLLDARRGGREAAALHRHRRWTGKHGANHRCADTKWNARPEKKQEGDERPGGLIVVAVNARLRTPHSMIRSHLAQANRYIAEMKADIARERVIVTRCGLPL